MIIHGNHEARAEGIGTYVSKEWNGFQRQNVNLHIFYFDNGKEQVEECGWIRIVDAKGTFGQSREVSYDIMTPEKGLYKHILESEIMGFKE